MRSLFLDRRFGMALVLSASTALWACGTGEALIEEEDFSEDESEVASLGLGRAFDSAGLREGDFIKENGIGAVVPPPGYWLRLESQRLDGLDETLIIDNTSGTVVVTRQRTEAAPVAPSDFGTDVDALSPSECSDGAYSFMFSEAKKWTKRYDWYFKASTTPAGKSIANFESSLKAAVADITNGRNHCNLTDAISATASYLGRTDISPQVISDRDSYQCGKFTERNVVGFGPMPKGVLGAACVWGSGTSIVKGDVKFNKAYYSWFAGRTVPSGCNYVFSVEGIATHEFGHVFGLGHVSESSHGNLTMSTQAGACTLAQSTLGRGDVLGLRALY